MHAAQLREEESGNQRCAEPAWSNLATTWGLVSPARNHTRHGIESGLAIGSGG